MDKVPLLDLRGQYDNLRQEIDAAVREVLDSGHFILGPNVTALEREIAADCGVGHAIGVANGTDALLLSLRALGVGPGDEVLTTPFTFFATAEVISLLGAVPVFVDIHPDTFNLDAEAAAKAITSKTCAIVPVHLFGQPTDMEPLQALAKANNLIILEDACQAIGAEYKGAKAGSLGDAAAFSFFPSKNLGAYGDGGMVVTKDPDLAEKIRLLRGHGSRKKYYHEILGYNSRLDELQAAILRVKLRHLEEWNEGRRQVAARYDAMLFGSKVVTPVVAVNVRHVYHQYTIRAANRDGLQAHLTEQGIGTAVYYPVPLHLQEVYRDLGYREGSLPAAEKAAEEVLSLPVFPELTASQQERVVAAIDSFYCGR